MRVINMYCDFETVTSNTKYFKEHNDTRITLFFLKEGNNEFYGTNIKDLIEIFKTYNKSICVYFHNLSFDGDFILKWLNTNGYKLINGWDIENGIANTFTFFRSGNKIFKIELVLKNNQGKTIWINFKCSLLILASGIEALGKALGRDKFKHVENEKTFYDVEPEQDYLKYSQNYLDYIKSDVEIAKESLELFEININEYLKNSRLKNLKRNIKLNDYLTIGSIAYELQRAYIKESPNILSGFKISKKSHDLISPFFVGGFTHFNPKIQYKTVECPNGLSVDINSAHPHSMTQLMPFGDLHEWDEQPKLSYEILEYYVIDVEEAISKYDSIYILKNWKRNFNLKETEITTNNHYSGYLRNFKCFYLKQEWEYILKFYDVKFKIVKKYWCYADYWLRDFVNDLYFYKQKYTHENKKAFANTFKLLLNSSYGKHATRMIFDSYYICKDENEYKALLEMEYFYLRDKEYVISEFVSANVKLDGCYILTITPTKEKDSNYNKIVASTITAYTRIKLYEMILKVSPQNFLYCDTDSVYMKDVNENDLKDFLDDEKLGKWKIEKRFKYFSTRGAKTYILLDENKKLINVTFGGLNKKWLKDNWDIGHFSTQEISLENAKMQRVQTKSGIVLMPKDLKLKHREV